MPASGPVKLRLSAMKMARDAGRVSYMDCLGGKTNVCGLCDGYADTYAFVGGPSDGPRDTDGKAQVWRRTRTFKITNLCLTIFKDMFIYAGLVRQVTVSVALCARALTGSHIPWFLQGGDDPAPPCPLF